jgi:hypothetical protein
MTGPDRPPGHPPTRPPGHPPALPTERTRLAWRRASLAVVTSCLFALAATIRRRDTSAIVVLALVLVTMTGISLLGLVQRRITTLSGPEYIRLGRGAALVGLGVAAFAALAAAMVVAIGLHAPR